MLGYVVCILHNCSFVLLRGSLFGIHLFTKRKQAQSRQKKTVVLWQAKGKEVKQLTSGASWTALRKGFPHMSDVGNKFTATATSHWLFFISSVIALLQTWHSSKPATAKHKATSHSQTQLKLPYSNYASPFRCWLLQRFFFKRLLAQFSSAHNWSQQQLLCLGSSVTLQFFWCHIVSGS